MFKLSHLLKRLLRRKKQTAADDVDSANVTQPVAATGFDFDTLPSRYQAYGILYNAGIPLCLWCEDALEHLGVPTMTFCLFLIIPDARTQQAAEHLISAGYQKRDLPFAMSEIYQFGNIYGPPQDVPDTPPEAESKDYVGLGPKDMVDSAHPPVVLLPAREWFFELPGTIAEMDGCYPTLPQLLTGLIYKWMSLQKQDHALLLHLAVLIEYIYDYLDDVKKPGFEETLPQDTRGFHFDRLNHVARGDWETIPYQQAYMAEMEGRADKPWNSI